MESMILFDRSKYVRKLCIMLLALLVLTSCAQKEATQPEQGGSVPQAAQTQPSLPAENPKNEAEEIPAQAPELAEASEIASITWDAAYSGDPSASGDGRTAVACMLYPMPSDAAEPLGELPQSRSIRIHLAARVRQTDADEGRIWYLVSDKLDNRVGWVIETAVEPGLPKNEAIEYPGPYQLMDGTAYVSINPMTGMKTEQVFTVGRDTNSPLWNHGFDERVWMWHLVGYDGWEVWLDDLSGLEDYTGQLSDMR